MDLKDKKIIYELSKNSKISLNELSKKVELNKTTTHYRLQKLQQNQTILGTHAIIDYSALGLVGNRAYLNFQNTNTEKEKEIINWLKKRPDVHVLTTNIGFTDIVLISWNENQLIFHELIKKIKEKYHKELQIIEICPYVKAHHFTRNYLLNTKEFEILTIGNQKKLQLDELDKKILETLCDDARQTTLSISNKTKSTPRTIIDRIKKLEKNKIIIGYSINLNYEKLGIEYHKLNIVFGQNINYTKLLSFAAKIPETVFVDETTSKYDFELNLEVKNHSKVEEIIKMIKNEFENIKEIKTFKLKKFEKFVYIPK